MHKIFYFILLEETKKIGHKLVPDKYTAKLLKSRFNQAGNLELTLANVEPADLEYISAVERS